MALTSFQSEGEDGEELEVGVATDDGGMLVDAMVGGDKIVEGSDIGTSSTWSLELRITLWAPACRSSLVARVTSLMSAATWFPVLERGSDLLFRNSARRLAFLLIEEGLFLLTALAAEGKLSLVSKEKAKVDPMVREKVKYLSWLASAWQKSMHLAAKEESTTAIFLFYLNQENQGEDQKHMLPLWLSLGGDYSNLQLIQKTVNKTSTRDVENNVKLTKIISNCDKFNAVCLKRQEKCK